jgi:hypothetical protein
MSFLLQWKSLSLSALDLANQPFPSEDSLRTQMSCWLVRLPGASLELCARRWSLYFGRDMCLFRSDCHFFPDRPPRSGEWHNTTNDSLLGCRSKSSKMINDRQPAFFMVLPRGRAEALDVQRTCDAFVRRLLPWIPSFPTPDRLSQADTSSEVLACASTRHPKPAKRAQPASAQHSRQMPRSPSSQRSP